MMEQPAKSQPEKGRHYTEEADIGSGEKTPGEQDTDEQIRKIPPLPEPGVKPASAAVSAAVPR
ncbi:hypothetical protein [Duganella sp. Root336D2]|uniref:hypothetical protein n=1 Tax=Duganella sp. Root336D2 TaxID=1736518 RepID=UPI0006FB67FF|nr:hypothetical protein [Duganella sp. Root336D2]KQV46462.1 hypothetical protein ASD07_13350 [Duganella sp. Root336D2]